MSISSQRIAIRTNSLLQQYLQNGTLPDELIIQQELIKEFAAWYNPTTGTFNVDVPLWQPSNIRYRDQSSAELWNLTQTSAAEDTTIAYADFLNDINTLTGSLYDYINRSNLIKNKIANLVSRIQNLLLISTATDGFIYSFFDNFVDTSKASFIIPYITTALVNTSSQNVELPLDITTGVSGAQQVTSIVNMLFLQPSNVSFSILNPVTSQQSLSGAQLTDIFTNQATAWQQEIIINGPGPLVCDLSVQISALEPILINKININTKMSNYANQILVQVLTSEDGVSYNEVDSPSNPQYIGQNAEFNFTPVFASYVKFIITKNTADSGATYNIGFQYIDFQQVSYALEADLYSIPISFPDERAISKVAIETCTVEPNSTGISYYITRLSGNPIPISSDTDTSPAFPQVVNLGSLTDVSEDIFTGQGNNVWLPDGSGHLSSNIIDLAGTNNINLTDITIPNTMTIWRDFGGAVAAEPSGTIGWQTTPSGFTGQYFKTYINIANAQGVQLNLGNTQAFLDINNTNEEQFNIGNSQAFVDNNLVNGAISLGPGIHTIATQDYNQLQTIIANNSDVYFAWNMQFKAPFDFYNNVSPNDPSVFTYDSISGDIIINTINGSAQVPQVDFINSFLASPTALGTYRSSTIPISTASFTAPAIVNAGSSINITVGPEPQWVNEIQLQINSSTNTTISVLSSIDNITFTTVLSDQPGPIAGATSFGALIFNTPVYTKYIKIIIQSGSAVSTNNGFINLFAPIQIQPGTIQTLPFVVSSACQWNSLTDTIQLNNQQTYQIFSAFDSSLITNLSYPSMSYEIPLETLYNPYIYAKITSNNSSFDPYIYGVELSGTPISNEASVIKFSYISPGSTSTTNTIIFKAHLVSTQQGITPQLQSYRVKML